MGLAPNPQFPERFPVVYERKMAEQRPMNRGPLRFEEGVATDTDIPNSFQDGIAQGQPGARNRNQKVDTKYADETLAERAHLGSASWIEAPTFLAEFAQGSFADYPMPFVDRVLRSGGRYLRHNPTVVTQ